jgi:hypothetical protein
MINLPLILGIIIGLLILFFFIIVPLLILIIAMIEKQNIKRLEPISLEKEQVLLAATKPWIDEAITNNFKIVGNYTDGDKGISEGFICLLISNDNKTILWIQKSLSPRFRFISQIESGNCIITSNIKSTLDLSKLEIEEMLPLKNLTDVYKQHLERIQKTYNIVFEDNAQSLIDWFDLFKKEKVKRMLSMGYAKYIDESEKQFKYTFKGAIEIVKDQLKTNVGIIKQTQNANESAKAYK